MGGRILLCVGACATVVLAQSPGTFIATGSMITPRSFHAATLLNDGRVFRGGSSVQNDVQP